MNGAGEHVTIGATANLMGAHLDPAFLFVGAQSSKKKLTSQLRDAGFENPLVLMKKGKASMDDILFTEYLELFASELQRKGYTGQHILMVDNHDSHERSRPIETAMRNNIIIFTFPSHCTHLVQMLDVSFFKSLKSHYKKVCKEWLDTECLQTKPYISKVIFLQLFHRAWGRACTPSVFTNGWARMGLTSCATSGMVVINRTAIADVTLGASEKYQDEDAAMAIQSVRVKGGVDDAGVLQFHDFDYDFSVNGLEKLATSDPKVYGMYLASRTYMMKQPGFVMHQRDVRPCKIAKPTAQVLTTAVNLQAAKNKDARKNLKTTQKKMTALANIGKELGKVINIDGVDLIAPKTRSERNVYCEYCKRTLTRACQQAACKDKAKGRGAKAALPKGKRKRGKEEWTSDGEDSDEDDLELDSDDASSATVDEIEVISPEDPQPWIKDPKGKQAVGRYFNTFLLTEDPNHESIPAKVTRYYLYEKKFNMLEFKFRSPEMIWEYEMSSVQEVYEAILATATNAFDPAAIALHNQLSGQTHLKR
jgi:hypothetical protein